jgi:FemAB-related protein (PEP-CTERM system-associated)
MIALCTETAGRFVPKVDVLPEAPDAAWLRAVDASAHARLAHAPEWRTVIERAYSHTPLYLTAVGEDGSYGVLPAFVVRRPLFGTVVTSMPFLDGGGPCSTSTAIDALLLERLMAEARRQGARLVELRSAARLAVGVEPLESKVNMTLALDGADAVWRRVGKGVRNQIRKAERAGLTVEHGGPHALADFYDTFAERMHDLGSPVHALPFLRQVIDAFGARARVALVKKGTATVGGLVALRFKDRVVVPWASCRKEYFSLCPNMLLYWESIRAACADGCARFDFGRSTRLSGTYHFKRQWGAEEEPLYWYRIPLAARRSRHPEPASTGGERLARMWQRLPLSVTRHIGPRIRRYLIQ